jgi:hypothetical protein
MGVRFPLGVRINYGAYGLMAEQRVVVPLDRVRFPVGTPDGIQSDHRLVVDAI